ncbi:uncharacterized protein EDB93DRAFT_1135178, partial [Suillus bovinus]|uniref:uncharacterized protein n=1 Tax=Suillus bovinus TaxID=48563 RepID=UPI001B863CA2
MWDAATGQPLGEPLKGHTGYVWSVSFSPDGTRIASGSDDNTVRMWGVVKVQPSPKSRDPDSSTSLLHQSTVPPTQFPESRKPDSSASPLHQSTAPPTRESHVIPTCSNRLVSFSSSLEHALPNPTDLLEPPSHHDSDSTPFLPQADGWV